MTSRSRWQPGSCPEPTGGVFVSVTDFAASSARELPRIARAGYRLRRAWPRLPGAVGMWLWADVASRRSGSVSVWLDVASLQAFVRCPEHVVIMRTYRGRGQIRATSWEVEHFDPDDTWRSAARWLSA